MHDTSEYALRNRLGDIPRAIRAIEAELSAARIGIADFCDRAGINRSTWTRWKAGRFEPRREQWRRVVAALASLRTLEPPVMRIEASVAASAGARRGGLERAAP